MFLFLNLIIFSRRIYVGNLPMTVTEDEICKFFNATMVAAQGQDRDPGDSVTNVYLNSQKRYENVYFLFFSFLFFLFFNMSSLPLIFDCLHLFLSVLRL